MTLYHFPFSQNSLSGYDFIWLKAQKFDHFLSDCSRLLGVQAYALEWAVFITNIIQLLYDNW